jgi:hypothetical protein
VRNSMRVQGVLSLAGCALLTAITACGSGSPAAASQRTESQRTETVYVSPVTASGVATAGYRTTNHAGGANCEPGSEAIGQAYRCFAGNLVYDPCWAEKAAAPTVLCMPAPWSRTDARLTVSSALTAIPSEGGIDEPWGVQLRDGQRCALVQGAHNVFGGRPLDYYCSPGLSLLRGLRKAGGIWVLDGVFTKSGRITSGPPEKIAIAWFGSPGQFR